MLRSIVCLSFVIAAQAGAAQDGITLDVEPEQPLIEMTRAGQALNFDLILDNGTAKPLEVSAIELTLRDVAGNAIMRRQLNQNGGTIAVVPERKVASRKSLLIFNPLPLWPADVSIDRIDVSVEVTESESGAIHFAKQTIKPHRFEPKTTLRLPVEGTLLVHAGHDLLSHHRRFPLHSPLADALRIEHNVTRYAYDFAVVDERGELTGGGAPVVAPASGRVVEVQRDQPDNEIGKPPRLEAKLLVENPRRLFGNYVLIEHAAGELSLLAHLRMGSVTVRVGDQVGAGQRLGAVGMSGDASLPHLHFQLQAGAGFAEGLPARFDGVSRKIGERWVAMPAGSIESGEIVRSIRATAAGL